MLHHLLVVDLLSGRSYLFHCPLWPLGPSFWKVCFCPLCALSTCEVGNETDVLLRGWKALKWYLYRCRFAGLGIVLKSFRLGLKYYLITFLFLFLQYNSQKKLLSIILTCLLFVISLLPYIHLLGLWRVENVTLPV